MRTIKFFLFIIFSVAAIFLIAATEPPDTEPVSEKIVNELTVAFDQKIQISTTKSTISIDVFTPEIDSVYLNEDGDLAVIWLALRDEYGRKLASEPGLAIGRLVKGEWEVVLMGDSDWDFVYSQIPENLLPAEMKSVPKDVKLDELNQPLALTGYYLPYVAGTKQWLEGSISHFQNIPELGYPSCDESVCRYAYDFTNTDHFPLVASKEGTVEASKDSCTNGNSSCTNYIVLIDTNGSTYQIYLHLAQGTIPDKLTKGRTVKRGEYLGDTDDTGYSTSNHVHFMVVDSLWEASGYYWGRSIDVRFADVLINGGIPRTCYEVSKFEIFDNATQCLGNKSDPRNPANDWFVSGNIGAYPPTGSLSRPAAGDIVATGNNPNIDVTANADDDVRVKAVQLVAKINNQWVGIGPQVTNGSGGNYDWDVNLCTVAPLNGELEVALRVWDHEGNVASNLSPRKIIVDHACPPPTSSLNPAESFDSTAIKLTWQANSGGAGISAFELQWKTMSGNWSVNNQITISGNQRSAWFVGQAGETYEFRLRAIDNNNQLEAWPAGDISETTASMPTGCDPDGFEPDDSIAQAYGISPDDLPQRNLCTSKNPDWFTREVTEPGNYQVYVRSVTGGSAVKATVFLENEGSIISSSQAVGAGQDLRLIFEVENPGRYFVKIEPLYDALFGTEAIYELSFEKVFVSYLPIISR